MKKINVILTRAENPLACDTYCIKGTTENSDVNVKQEEYENAFDFNVPVYAGRPLRNVYWIKTIGVVRRMYNGEKKLCFMFEQFPIKSDTLRRKILNAIDKQIKKDKEFAKRVKYIQTYWSIKVVIDENGKVCIEY